jgi:ABC-type polar amino acid transport system ATPase subunit
VLETLADLAQDGITIICVTHEMGFARKIADRVIFMDQARSSRKRPHLYFFENPKEARTRHFLEQILH